MYVDKFWELYSPTDLPTVHPVLHTVTDCWSKLHMQGDAPPSYIEEHSIISYQTRIYVFGGVHQLTERNDCPLWIFDTGQLCHEPNLSLVRYL